MGRAGLLQYEFADDTGSDYATYDEVAKDRGYVRSLRRSGVACSDLADAGRPHAGRDCHCAGWNAHVRRLTPTLTVCGEAAGNGARFPVTQSCDSPESPAFVETAVALNAPGTA